MKDEKSEQRKARYTAAMTKVQATYNANVVSCGDCGAKFQKLRDGSPPVALTINRSVLTSYSLDFARLAIALHRTGRSP